MRIHVCRILSVAVALLLAPVVSSAAGSVGIEAFGAFNRYSMNDAKQEIDGFRSDGLDFQALTPGATGGFGIRMWAGPDGMFSLTWEPLRVETQTGAGHTYSLDANSFQVTGAYFLPTTRSVRYGLGAGVSQYSIHGKAPYPTIDAVGNPIWETTDLGGSGLGLHVLALSEYRLGGMFSINAGVGFRFAQIEIDDRMDTATADYSGFMGRLGMAWYLPVAR